MFDEAAHDRIAKMKREGMISGYGRAEVIGKALATGGEECAAEVEAALARHEAGELMGRALEDVPAELWEDTEVLAEALDTESFAAALVARIRALHARQLDEGAP